MYFITQLLYVHMQGDIDRDVVGTTNHPLPYHLMGTVRSPSNSVYILTAGLPQEFVKGTQVKVCHVFRPDIVCDGEVTDCSENTATVIVTDSHIWTQTLEDIRKVCSNIPVHVNVIYLHDMY